MSDQSFLERLDLAGQPGHYALGIRRALATLCCMAPDDIRPEDSPVALSSRMIYPGGREWDDMAFVFELEDTLGIAIDAEFSLPAFVDRRFLWWHRKGPSTVGEWIKQVANILQRSTTSGHTTP